MVIENSKYTVGFAEAKAERASIRDYFTNVIPSDYPVAPHITQFFNPEQSLMRREDVDRNEDTSHFLFNHSIGTQNGSFEFRNFWRTAIKIGILIASHKWHRLNLWRRRESRGKGGGSSRRRPILYFDVTTRPFSSDATRTVY